MQSYIKKPKNNLSKRITVWIPKNQQSFFDEYDLIDVSEFVRNAIQHEIDRFKESEYRELVSSIKGSVK